MEKRRVVITGKGVYTPFGENNKTWENLINGNTSIRNCLNTHSFLETCDSQIGSLFYYEQLMPEKLGINPRERKRMCHHSKIAFAAVRQAVKESGIFDKNSDKIKERTGVAIGGGFGGITEIEKNSIKISKKGLNTIDGFIAFKALPGAASGYITSYYNLHSGDAPSFASACSSGLSSIIYGVEQIKLGLADAYISGGTGDASPLTFAGFTKIRATSRRNNDAEHASRPFDKDRDGFVIGDGAGVVLLEEYNHAKKRGANILAEILGYGKRLDGSHPTRPREDVKYSVQAIQQALNMAKLNLEDIDYINVHGTSTKDNDKYESLTIKKTFGDYAYKIPVSSTKSMIGHTLNAAGGIELAVSVMSLDKGVIHPIKNLENPDTENECNLNYVMNNAMEKQINYTLKNSAGFNGRNVCIILGKV